MSALSQLRVKAAKAWPFQTLPPIDWSTQKPTYGEANPAVIRSALARAQRRTGGNWYAFAASSQIAAKAWGATVAGVQIVAWRGADGGLLVAPRACPHLGADLSTAPVECGTLVCPWHGLRLSDRRHGAWKPFPAHDDGVLCWVRLDAVGGEIVTDVPIASVRPRNPRLAAVARLEGVCEPCDIIANRLDPWHGSWFHPHSFTRLEVLSAPRCRRRRSRRSGPDAGHRDVPDRPARRPGDRRVQRSRSQNCRDAHHRRRRSGQRR